jgi:hypothetical protein
MVKKNSTESGDADDDQPRAPEVQDVLASTNIVEEASDTGVSETGKKFTKIIQHIAYYYVVWISGSFYHGEGDQATGMDRVGTCHYNPF